MILGKLFRSRLVYRYIISYIFVFLIPFICLSLFIYYQSASSLQKEIEQSNVNKLEQVETITNERINELEKMASSIAYTPGLSPYMVKHGYYGGEATKELRTFKENSSIIGEVFVYYYDQDPFLYSSNGPYTFQSLLQHSYQFEILTTEMLKKSLHEKIPNVLLPDKVTFRNGTQEQVMAFIYPIAPGNPNPYGAVMFFVQESLLTNLIENILNDFQGSTYILDENQQPIVSAVNGDGLAWEHLAQDVLQQKGVHTLQLDNKEYSISSVTSEVSGWTFVTIMDTDQFTDRVIQQETLWGVLCMILLIIGVTVAVLMAQNQYRPIERLAKLTKNNQPAANWSDRNEIETIHQTIADMMEDRQQLSETIDLQEPYAKGQLLHNMLKGNFSNEDTIDELLAALHMSMHQGPHFVMIIEWMSDVPDRDPWMSSLLDSLLPNVTINEVELLEPDMFALIISLEEEGDRQQQRRDIAVHVKHKLMEELAMPLKVMAIGNYCEEKRYINRSFIEALTALEYKMTVSPGSLLYFEELGSVHQGASGYPQEDQLKLAQSIKEGDAIVAMETLDTILDNLLQLDLSVQALRYICFDIINSVIKTTMELGVTNNMDIFREIGEFDSIGSLKNSLQPIILKMCHRVEEKKESRSEHLRKEILAFIHQHYKEFDLSLERLADHFHLSVPYLSKFIKEQTRETFTQYVLHLRMKEAKKLLRETNQPIKAIVEQIGYKDVANFTRRFKQIEQTTPGQYRKLTK